MAKQTSRRSITDMHFEVEDLVKWLNGDDPSRYRDLIATPSGDSSDTRQSPKTLRSITRVRRILSLIVRIRARVLLSGRGMRIPKKEKERLNRALLISEPVEMKTILPAIKVPAIETVHGDSARELMRHMLGLSAEPSATAIENAPYATELSRLLMEYWLRIEVRMEENGRTEIRHVIGGGDLPSEGEAVAQVLALAAKDDLHRVRLCLHCGRYFYAQQTHQDCCSLNCTKRKWEQYPKNRPKRQKTQSRHYMQVGKLKMCGTETRKLLRSRHERRRN